MATAARDVRVSTGYVARPHQRIIHRGRKRFNVLVCHRRFGKTVLTINELIDEALRNRLDRPRYAYIAPLFKQAKAVAWDYLKAFTRPIPGAEVHESELRVTLPGDRQIRLYGADNPDALRGLYLDGVVLDEYAQMAPRTWTEVVRPALSDRKGWAIFIGTPMGHNAFHDMYQYAAQGNEGWWAAMFKASETGIIDPLELRDAKATMGEDEYEQEYECSFEAAIKGAYFGVEMRKAEDDKRIDVLPHDPNVPVYTAWDIGVGDSTSIWFVQLVGHRIHVVDFYEASGEGLAHYVSVLQKRGYVYAEHFGPHDLMAREWGSGRSRQEQAKELGIKFKVVPNVAIDDGINAVRTILPRCVFDRAKCQYGIEALKQYRKDWDEDHKVFRDKPLHDWTSHAADAFRYLALGVRERYTPPPPRWERTLNELIAEDMLARGHEYERRI